MGPEIQKQTQPAAKVLPESLLEVALPALAQAGGGQEGRDLGAQLQPHIPHPVLGKVSSPGIKEGLVPGEAGARERSASSLLPAPEVVTGPLGQTHFVFIILRFWSLAGELLLVPISRCSCSQFSPPSYFCWVIGDQLPARDVCEIWGNVSRGFQLHELGQANRANILGIDEEGTLQKIGLEGNSDSPERGQMEPDKLREEEQKLSSKRLLEAPMQPEPLRKQPDLRIHGKALVLWDLRSLGVCSSSHVDLSEDIKRQDPMHLRAHGSLESTESFPRAKSLC